MYPVVSVPYTILRVFLIMVPFIVPFIIPLFYNGSFLFISHIDSIILIMVLLITFFSFTFFISLRSDNENIPVSTSPLLESHALVKYCNVWVVNITGNVFNGKQSF